MATILIIDDQPTNREYLLTLLGYGGHRLLQAANGAEGLAVAKAELPGLVIADILMRTMDGYEFVRQLRADPAIAAAPVIFYTAHYLEREARALAQACGVFHVLTKPCEPEAVLHTVNAALNVGPIPTPRLEKVFVRDHLRLLTDKLAQKADELRRVNERLTPLINLGLDLASERDPTRLLQSFCHRAREVIGARYAVVAVTDGDGQHLRHCITGGMDPVTAARLGSIDPRQSVLGTVLNNRQCCRLRNAAGDPGGLGFSSSFPHFHTLLTAPIVSPTRVYGWLCLLDKLGAEEFSPEDEQLAGIVAAQVGRIYENGSLYADVLRRAAELEKEVAERKGAERTLQDSHNLLRAVLEGIPDAVYVKDRRSRNLLANSVVARFAGKSAEQMRGEDDTAWFEPESARRFMEADRRVMESGETETHEEVAMVAGDSRTFLTTKAPYRGPQGEILGVLGISRDITERTRAEAALRRQKEILQTIFDHIPVMLNFIDSTGRAQLVNRHWEKVLGWSLEEAQARDLVPEFHPDPMDRQRVAEYISNPPPGWSEFKTRVRDGRTIDTAWALVALSDGTRVGIGQDITERKRAEKVLEQYAARLQALSRRLLTVQEEERRHLARELHDEFGQILTTITLHLHAAKKLAGGAALPRLEECATLLQQAGEQVRSLALELRPTMLDTLGLEATLRWLAKHHQQRTGTPVQVVGHLSGAPLSAELAIACFRVAQEALTNVVRHAAARHVWVELSQDESVLELAVRDDGVGFDVLPTQERAAQRGRLGLLGMRERVQILGGSLDVESEPGRGTRIRASFPLSEVPEEPVEPAE